MLTLKLVITHLKSIACFNRVLFLGLVVLQKKEEPHNPLKYQPPTTGYNNYSVLMEVALLIKKLLLIYGPGILDFRNLEVMTQNVKLFVYFKVLVAASIVVGIGIQQLFGQKQLPIWIILEEYQ